MRGLDLEEQGLEKARCYAYGERGTATSRMKGGGRGGGRRWGSSESRARDVVDLRPPPPFGEFTRLPWLNIATRDGTDATRLVKLQLLMPLAQHVLDLLEVEPRYGATLGSKLLPTVRHATLQGGHAEKRTVKRQHVALETGQWGHDRGRGWSGS